MSKIISAIKGSGKQMDDKTIAMDMLTASKSSMMALVIALSHAGTPEVRHLLKRQLDDAISFQQKAYDYMLGEGWYNPYDVDDQLRQDLRQSEEVMKSI